MEASVNQENMQAYCKKGLAAGDKLQEIVIQVEMETEEKKGEGAIRDQCYKGLWSRW